jgi:hypothetical protein
MQLFYDKIVLEKLKKQSIGDKDDFKKIDSPVATKLIDSNFCGICFK